MGKNLPPRVFLRSGRYYHVSAEGKRRVWVSLSRVREGLPALYAALAQIERERIADDRMSALIADWQLDVMPRHAAKTQRDDIARCRIIGQSFAEFRAGQVRAPDVAEFLAAWRDKPRTHNAYRAQLRELMRYAIERGYRVDQPCDHIRTMRTPPRHRYVTDSELRRVKVAALRGSDGKPTRSGRMLCALLDVLYLTGQRPSDVLDLRWVRDPDDPDAPHISDAGLVFRPSKTRRSSCAAVVIEWTPRLRDAIRRAQVLQAERLMMRRADQRVVSGWVFTTISGSPMQYFGASSAWQRAVRRAGVVGIELRDLRAKALTDKEGADGMPAARAMGAHSTESQTADYVRRRAPTKTKATR
jgi:integrase